MKKILIVYATHNGQTKRIALKMCERLTAEGFRVELSNLKSSSLQSFEDFDGIIAGSSVHFSKFQKHFREVIAQNAYDLSRTPSAFFSVCLGIVEKSPTTQTAERKIVTDFFSQMNWQPDQWTIFGGALAYTQYGWIKKQMMRLIARKAGGSTDTLHDHDYTDWKAVDLFATDFGILVSGTSLGAGSLKAASLSGDLREI